MEWLLHLEPSPTAVAELFLVPSAVSFVCACVCLCVCILAHPRLRISAMKQLSVLTLGMWPGQYVQLEQVKKKGKYPQKMGWKSLFYNFIARARGPEIS